MKCPSDGFAAAAMRASPYSPVSRDAVTSACFSTRHHTALICPLDAAAIRALPYFPAGTGMFTSAPRSTRHLMLSPFDDDVAAAVTRALPYSPLRIRALTSAPLSTNRLMNSGWLRAAAAARALPYRKGGPQAAAASSPTFPPY